MKYSVLGVIITIFKVGLLAQNEQDTIQNVKVFELGEVVLYHHNTKEKVSQKEWEQYNKTDVAKSLNMMPSIVQSHSGARNESSIYMRGFDIRSIPVYVDGIPIYVPYDGYMDLSRFTTADLSKIEVSKGFSSILYGPNALGGTINLVSTQPYASFELNAKASLLSCKGFNNHLKIGTKQKKFFVQGIVTQFDRQYLPLSKHDKSTQHKTNAQLLNSYSYDRKYTTKLGYTPNENDTYVLNYILQKSSKGNPVYEGTDENVRLRYWQWPYWDKESIYFITQTRLTESTKLKTRWFYDTFQNKLSSYDDATYTTQTLGYAFNSFYDDKTYGVNFETQTNKGVHKLMTAFHYKYDHHSAYNEGDLPEHIKEATYSFGVEDIYKPTQRLRFISGLSYHTKQGITADNTNIILNDGSYEKFPNKNSKAFNAQIAGIYSLNSKTSFNTSVAYKTKFPTMKDRFSYRIGQAIPNPDLKAEGSMNFDVGLTYQDDLKFFFKPEVYYSQLFNTIQVVDDVEPGILQLQNTGKSVFYGADFTLGYQVLEQLVWQLNYSLVKRKNTTQPEILFTDVPEHHIYATLDYEVIKNALLTLQVEWSSDRYSTSYGTISKGFTLWHARTGYNFSNGLSAELGINNIFDTSYTLTEGYPEAGRNLFFGLQYQFSK
jgi:iron complex outermembrane receptor protein